MKLKVKVRAWRTVVAEKDKKKFFELTLKTATTDYDKIQAEDIKDDTSELNTAELTELIQIAERTPTFPAKDLVLLQAELTKRTFTGRADELDNSEDGGAGSATVTTPAPATPVSTERTPPYADRFRAETDRFEHLVQQGLADLGGSGDTWQARETAIKAWWAHVKEDEAAAKLSRGAQWTELFRANRMTIRQVDQYADRSMSFPVPRVNAKGSEPKDQTITLANKALDIHTRQDPANFLHAGSGKSLKDKLGLHDLSAHLLDCAKTIPSQLKGYSNALAIFMPVPSEKDMRIFLALQVLALKSKASAGIEEFRSRLTRIKLAQGSDMHTSFLDISANPASPKFRYGLAGTICIEKGRTGVPVDEADVLKRRNDAIEHSRILGAGAMEKANEIVLSYRQHESKRFPLFAVVDETDAKNPIFRIVTLSENPDFPAFARAMAELQRKQDEFLETKGWQDKTMSESDWPTELREPKNKVPRYLTTATGESINQKGEWSERK